MTRDDRDRQILLSEHMPIRQVFGGNDDGCIGRSCGNGLPLRTHEIRQVNGDESFRYRRRRAADHLHGGTRLVRKRPLPTRLALAERKFRIDRMGANAAFRKRQAVLDKSLGRRGERFAASEGRGECQTRRERE